MQYSRGLSWPIHVRTKHVVYNVAITTKHRAICTAKRVCHLPHGNARMQQQLLGLHCVLTDLLQLLHCSVQRRQSVW